MNYNELEFLDDKDELIKNEMRKALANNQMEYFNYLKSTQYTQILLDSMAKNMETCSHEEFRKGMKAVICSLNLNAYL